LLAEFGYGLSHLGVVAKQFQAFLEGLFKVTIYSLKYAAYRVCFGLFLKHVA